MAEEGLFRMVLAPLLFLALRRVALGPAVAALLTIGVVAVSFALLHEAGPHATFSAQYFATRVVMPGLLMGLAMFWISPMFIVTLHCTAHIVMPLLFH